MSHRLVLIVALAALVGVAAPLTVTPAADGKPFVITHPEYTLEVDAATGAAVFTKSRAGALHKPAGGALGLLHEVFTVEQMEKQLPKLDFSAELEEQTEQRVVLALSCLLPGELVGPDLADVTFTRRVICVADRPDVEVQWELHNGTDALRYVSMGARHDLRLEKHGNDFTHIPTTRNVIEQSKSGMVWNYYSGSAWHYQPVEGWIGVLDREAARGFAFVCDYNLLEGFYTGNRGNRLGWLIDGEELNPGATFRTSYRVIPISGFQGLVHASAELIADVTVKRAGERTFVTHTVASLQPVKELKIASTVHDVRTEAATPLKAVELTDLGMTPQVQRLAWPFEQTGAIVVRARAVGPDLTANWEYMSEGPVRMQPIPALELAVAYRRSMPPQPRTPAPGGAPPPPRTGPRPKKVLFYFGMYSNFYRYEEWLKDWDMKVLSAPPDRVTDLPPASQIDDYALIVLSDCNAAAFPASVIRRLRRYVERGGDLLVLGGPYAYGQGSYQTEGLEEILPVLSAPFDMKPRPGGADLRMPADHPVTKGLDLSAKPRIFWIHQCPLRSRKTSQVLLSAGEYDSALVHHRVGKGDVACFLGTPCGKAAEGELPFWEWDGWSPLMNRLVEWMYEARKEAE